MWFFVAIISAYSILLFYYTYIYVKKEKNLTILPLQQVTVIIPFRNEEDQLMELIQSFQNLDYPEELVEFIFVDDHSSDNSLYKLQELLNGFSFYSQILSLPNHLFGKKPAIELAVKHAQSPIIISTDADCDVPSNWLKLMQAPFHSSAIHLVSGSVVFRSKSFLEKIFQMEFAPLIGVGGVSIILGKAGMANGANLAFRKNTFLRLDVFNDNMHIPTGDDVFLLQKISQKHPRGVVFLQKSIVFTAPPINLKAFYHQRLRWASKWKATSENKNKLPAIAVWLFHFLYLIGIIGNLVEANYFEALILFSLKAISEIFFLFYILKSQQQKFNIFAFVLLQIIYSIYVILFGLLANFSAYRWKGRIYGKHER